MSNSQAILAEINDFAMFCTHKAHSCKVSSTDRSDRSEEHPPEKIAALARVLPYYEPESLYSRVFRFAFDQSTPQRVAGSP